MVKACCCACEDGQRQYLDDGKAPAAHPPRCPHRQRRRQHRQKANDSVPLLRTWLLPHRFSGRILDTLLGSRTVGNWCYYNGILDAFFFF